MIASVPAGPRAGSTVPARVGVTVAPLAAPAGPAYFNLPVQWHLDRPGRCQ